MTTPASARVVITGIGVVSAWGWGLEPFRRGLRSGRTAIGRFARFDATGYRTALAAEVPAPPPELPARFPGWARLTWSERFALAAAEEALARAAIDRAALAGRETGVYFGSSTGGMLEGEEWYARLRGALPGPADVRALIGQPVSAPAESVARRLGVTGPVETLSAACASGTQALEAALVALRAGEVDLALAGGADVLCRVTFGGFNALRSVDSRPSRPFRAGREGLSLGEGGAVLVAEREDRALARGARPLAVLAGAASTADAHHMTAPHPEGRGAHEALGAALADAGLPPEAIDFVNAHGTGTPLNDVAEYAALAATFGTRLADLPVTSTKASVGHLLGTAGAIEAAATVLGLEDGEVQPTPGEGPLDPELPVRLVVGEPLRLAAARAAVSLNLAFGGCNAAVVLTSPAGPAVPPR